MREIFRLLLHRMGVWKAIKMGSEDLKSITSFRVENGLRLKFWTDGWCCDEPLGKAFPTFSIATAKDAQIVKA